MRQHDVAFGGHGTLENVAIDCSQIDLAAELYADVRGSLLDLGGNQCGCAGSTRTCKVKSANLEPPSELPAP